MKQTLLQMTQSILSNLNSDEVNSISDTTESMQVAEVIKQTYFNFIARAQLPEHYDLFQLISANDSTQPVVMTKPDNIKFMDWVKYFDTSVTNSTTSGHGINTDIVSPNWTTTSTTSNTIALGSHTFTVTAGLAIGINSTAKAVAGVNSMIGTVTSYTGTTLIMNVTSIVGSGTYTSWVISMYPGVNSSPEYKYVTILPNQQFIDMVNGFNILENDVDEFNFSVGAENFKFLYKTQQQPRFCTVIKDFYLIFDAYDEFQDSTLQSTKTMCWGQFSPSWSMVDSFIPDLDDQQFPLLLNEAKSLAFLELKQMSHPKAEQESKRQWGTVQKNKSLVDKPSYFDALPNFGRIRGTNSSLFRNNGWR